MKKILVAYEESQMITKEFRKLGHQAFSCDIQPCSGGHPEWHLKQDIFTILSLIYVGKWDIIIAHPPCTALCVSGNHKYAKGKSGYKLRKQAVTYVNKLWNLLKKHTNKICIENPIGVLPTMSKLPKPQYIQPYEFGENASKKTGLYLYNLPNLKPTLQISGRLVNGKERWGNQTNSGQNKLSPSKERAKIRSKTYKGIAKAMAIQWG